MERRRRSPKSRRGGRVRGEPFAWLGAGAITLGIGAALAAGCGVAAADSPSDGSSASSMSHKASAPRKASSNSRAATTGIRAAGTGFHGPENTDRLKRGLPSLPSVGVDKATTARQTPVSVRRAVIASEKMASPVSAPVARAAATPADPFLTAVGGVLSSLGLTVSARPPADPLGEFVWTAVRGGYARYGLVPWAGAPTVSAPDLVTGAVTGTLGFTEPAGLPLTYAVTGGPLHGAVTVDSTGAYTYIPDSETPVSDTFTITASDGWAASSNYVSVPVVTIIDRPPVEHLSGVVVSPDGSRLYVTSAADAGNGHGTVLVIDTATNNVIGVIEAGRTPQAVAISPDGKHLYVSDYVVDSSVVFPDVNGALSVIDTTSNTVTNTIQVGVGPFAVAASGDGSHVYVTNSDGTLSVIDTVTNTNVATIPVGRLPFSVAVSPDSRTVYVADYAGGTLSAIDSATNRVINTIDVGGSPIAVVVSPDGKRVYVANDQSWNSKITIVNATTHTVIGTVGFGVAPVAVAISPDGRYVYVTDSVNDSNGQVNGGNYGAVLAIDTVANDVVSVIPIGYSSVNITPDALAISPDGSRIYTANSAYYGLTPEYNKQWLSVISV